MAVRTIVLSLIALCACQVLHIVDFLGSHWLKTAPTSIEVILRPTQSQSDEPSDLHGSLCPRHDIAARCPRVYGTWQSQAINPSKYKPGAKLLNFSDQADTDETTPYSVLIMVSRGCWFLLTVCEYYLYCYLFLAK